LVSSLRLIARSMISAPVSNRRCQNWTLAALISASRYGGMAASCAPRRASVAHAAHLPRPAIDIPINRARTRDVLVDWGIGFAQRVFGVSTPAKALAEIRTRHEDVSLLITQDVLLMAGAEDHDVPLNQLSDQILTVTNARSVTARVFTPR
jgi:hypothetical protein